MVSKARVLLLTLVLLLEALGLIGLLVALDADAAWFKILPIPVLGASAVIVHALGWLDRKPVD